MVQKIQMGMEVDYQVGLGSVNTDVLVRELAARLQQMNLPMSKIAPNVQIDTKRTAAQITAQMTEALAQAEKQFAQAKGNISKATGSDVVKAEQLMRQAQGVRNTLRNALDVIAQDEMQKYASTINQKLLKTGLTRLESGGAIGPKIQAELDKYQQLLRLQAQQMSAAARAATSVGRGGNAPQFAVGLGNLAGSLGAEADRVSKALTERAKLQVDLARQKEQAVERTARATVTAYEVEGKGIDKLSAKERAAHERRVREANEYNALLARQVQLRSQLAQGGLGALGRAQTIELARIESVLANRAEQAGGFSQAAQLRASRADLLNPTATAGRLVNSMHVDLGNRVLDSIGGIANIGQVSAQNAPYVRAAIQSRISNLGIEAQRNPGDSARLAGEIQSLEQAMMRLDTATGRTTGTVAQFFRYALGYGALYQALGAVNALGKGVSDLQRTLIAIKAVSGATDAQMISVAVAIKEVASSSRYSLTDIGDAAKLLAQAGVSASEMGGALRTVTNLASAVEAPIAVVADLMTSMKEVFVGQSDESLANQLAAAVNVSKLSAEGLQTIIGLSAGIAKSLNLDTQQYLAAVATLKNAGLKDSTTATGLRQLLLELSSPDDKLIAALQARYKAIGEKVTNSGIKDRFFDFFQKPGGLVNALTEFERLGYMGEGRQSFGRALDIRAQNALEALIRDKGALIKNETAIGFSQAATIGSQQQMESLTAAVQQMKNSFILLGDSIGRDALPPLVDFLNMVTDLIKKVSEFNEQLRSDSGSGLGSVFGLAAAGGAAGFLLRGGNLRSRLLAAGSGAAAGAAGGAANVAANQSGLGVLGDMLGLALTGAQLAALWRAGRADRGVGAVAGAAAAGPATLRQAGAQGLSTAVNAATAVMTFFSGGWWSRLAPIALRLVGGIPGIVISGLAALAYWLYDRGPKDAAEIKRQIDSAQRLATDKANRYQSLKSSAAEFDLSRPGQYSGLGLGVANVDRQRGAALREIGKYAGGDTLAATSMLNEIYSRGGTSSQEGASLTSELKRRYSAFAVLDDRTITELSTFAAQAEQGPQALAEKMLQQYQQLKELSDRSVQQQAYVDLFEQMRLDVEGFGSSSEQMMENVHKFFAGMQNSSSAAGAELEAARGEAEKAAVELSKKMEEALNSSDFNTFSTSISSLINALHGAGMSASDYLLKMADKADRTAQELRKGPAFGFLETEAARKEREDAARIQEGAAEAARRAAAGVREEAAKKNQQDLQDMLAQAQRVIDNLKRMGPEEAARYRANPDVRLAQKIVNDKDLPGLLSMNTAGRMYVGQPYGLSSEGPSGEGRIGGFKTNIDRLAAQVTATGNSAMRFEEEQAAAREEAEKLRARQRELQYEGSIARLQGDISSAGTLPELRAVFANEGGKGNAFDQLAVLMRDKYGAKGANLDEIIANAREDLRDKSTRKTFSMNARKELENSVELVKKLEELEAKRRDALRSMDLKEAEALKKSLEDQVKIKERDLQVAMDTGASTDLINQKITEQQALQKQLAEVIGEVARKRGEDGDAAKKAYLEANVGVDKEIALLNKAIAARKALSDEAASRLAYSSLGMSSYEYDLFKAMGRSLSGSDLAYQQGKIFEERKGMLSDAYDKQGAAALKVDLMNPQDSGYQAAVQALQQVDAEVRNLENDVANLEASMRYLGGEGMFNALKDGFDLKDAVNNKTQDWNDIATGLRQGVVGTVDAIGESFVRAQVEGLKFKDVMRNITQQIAVDIATMLAKRAVWQFFSAIFGGFGGFGGGPDAGTTSMNMYGSGMAAARGGVVHMAGGGIIRGAGTGISDSVPAFIVDGKGRAVSPLMVSNREGILNANAVSMLGEEFVHAANSGAVRRAAAGSGYSARPVVVASNTSVREGDNISVTTPVTYQEGEGGSKESSQAKAQQLGTVIDAAVKQALVKETRPGGLLWRNR